MSNNNNYLSYEDQKYVKSSKEKAGNLICTSQKKWQLYLCCHKCMIFIGIESNVVLAGCMKFIIQPIL